MQSCCPWKVSKYIKNMQYFSLAIRYILNFCLILHIQNIVDSWVLKFTISSLRAQKVIKCILSNLFFQTKVTVVNQRIQTEFVSMVDTCFFSYFKLLVENILFKISKKMWSLISITFKYDTLILVNIHYII